jgi:hypothetical protein
LGFELGETPKLLEAAAELPKFGCIGAGLACGMDNWLRQFNQNVLVKA